jgi:hypothetical protein
MWREPVRCTADPASQGNGYQPGVGGQHRPAPIPLNLTHGPLAARPARDGLAVKLCAPWRCATYLRWQVGDTKLAMPVDYAAPVLDAFSTLLASAATAEEVTR